MLFQLFPPDEIVFIHNKRKRHFYLAIRIGDLKRITLNTGHSIKNKRGGSHVRADKLQIIPRFDPVPDSDSGNTISVDRLHQADKIMAPDLA